MSLIKECSEQLYKELRKSTGFGILMQKYITISEKGWEGEMEIRYFGVRGKYISLCRV
jgi:hypothetical protein